METTSRIPVLEGRLPDFRLEELLQVVSIGRQYTGIELSEDDAGPVGAIYLKSGQVVTADDRKGAGRDAFFRLLAQSGPRFFVVFRVAPPPPSFPQPLGPVANLLVEASGALPTELPAPRRPSGATPSPERRVISAVPPRAVTLVPSRPAPPPALPSPRAPVAPGSSVKGGSVVAVVSPKGGVGKTTVALNLGTALACQQISVVLVDGTVTGDLDGALADRPGGRPGLGDLLLGKATLDQVLLPTAIPDLSLVPAGSAEVMDSTLTYSDQRQWRRVLGTISERAGVVIVDTPAGMAGVTQNIVASASHLLGVLQAEYLAQRAFSLFTRSLDRIAGAHRPAVLGIVINMLQADCSTSLAVLAKASSHFPRGWPFLTTLPRSATVLDASRAGVPLRLLDRSRPPPVAWLFDALAAEVAERLNIGLPRDGDPIKLLPS